MKKIIINEENCDEIRDEIKGVLQDAIKHAILNMLECSYEEILESNKFTKQNLESISKNISDNEELNDCIDNLVITKLENFAEKNNIEI